MPAVTLDHLRRFAVARSLFGPTTLPKAVARLGFVQADPIRAPARAQDLTLRHRVLGYRAGDLERSYPSLDIEEDFFVNYGFMPRSIHELMHPRIAPIAWDATRRARARSVLAFVRERGVVHPREVDAHFAHGKVKNWFGGSSNASTELLDGMHYRGMLRIARRQGGVRLYAAREPSAAPVPAADALDVLVDVVAGKYAPLPGASLVQLIGHLRAGVPQWHDQRAAALARAKTRLGQARLDGIDWYWPAAERPVSARHAPRDAVRLLAPFDPVVWDRRRFEMFWGWPYRFEAYTRPAQRVRGYYALPLLWRDQVIGWGNLSVMQGRLQSDFGFAGSRPRDAAFKGALDDELQRIRLFLGLVSA